MARKSQWPNEEMWQEVVQWKKGGLTYSAICGQLALSKNMDRFRLKEIPSEETVRKQVTRRLEKGGPSPTTTHGAGTDIHTQDIRSFLQEWLKWTKWPLPSPGRVPPSAWQEELNRPLFFAGTPLFEALRKGTHLPRDLWDTFNELEDGIRALLQDAEKLMRDIGEIAEKTTGLKVVATLQTERVRPGLSYQLVCPA